MNTRQAIRDGVPKWLFKIIGPWLVGSLIGFVAFPTLNETFRIFPEAQMSFSLVSGGLFQAIYLLFKNTILNKMVLALAAGLAAYSATENPIVGAGVAGVLIVGLVILSFFRKPEGSKEEDAPATDEPVQPQQKRAAKNPAVRVVTELEGVGGDDQELRLTPELIEALTELAEEGVDSDTRELATSLLKAKMAQHLPLVNNKPVATIKNPQKKSDGKLPPRHF